MAEDGNDGDCTRFQEMTYWTNFKSFRFFVFLPADFLSQIMIPKIFSEKLKDILPQMAVLKSPGGATWDVQLVRNNETLYFREGWKEFAEAHNFKENDLLIFKYERDSCFNVWVFDSRSLCEKAGSYFVWKSASRKNEAGENSQLKRKKHTGDSVDAAVHNENPELEGSDSELDPAGASMKKSRRKTMCGLRTSDAEASTPYTDKSPPSAAEKERPVPIADRELTKESFKVVMKNNNVSNYYRLSIPAPWSREYLAPKNQDVELRTDDKKWTARFNLEPRCGGGVLVSGWSKFVKDNSLKEFDVCVFQLVSQKDEPAIFDVLISRATPQVANQPSSKPSSV
ncbi:B3 domain-containing protein REM16 [Beta vulgaris subsp. vulgaris]|uniref:B3 domain-containing protein REM16 n=1 Tax=Beta vulgaris subsp. vulgaris TaxID=3555 RepID=UPI0020372A41|nr:B3 domain-containing protein REM16 [Beta vulgaris subsp. vulgaris]